MKVKICGITSLQDALAAVEAGADLLGFNFFPPSPRYLTPETCADIIAALRDRGETVTAVGVFVNESPETISAILAYCELNLAQLSGDEPPEYLEKLGKRAFKGLRPQGREEAVQGSELYYRFSGEPSLLVDAYRPGIYGGSGHTGDWEAAFTLAQQVPILLAGGLHPGNVSQAVAQVRPWGVDVASGVESSPGRKDPAQMAAFIRAARAADEHLLFEKESS